jgi:hypothetical protein
MTGEAARHRRRRGGGRAPPRRDASPARSASRAAAAAQRIDAGGVTVGGRPARRSRTVVAGEVVEVAAVAPVARRACAGAPARPLPRRASRWSSRSRRGSSSIRERARGRHARRRAACGGRAARGGRRPSRPGIVHRLDRDTSGLLVVASTSSARGSGRDARGAQRHPPLPRAVVGSPRSRAASSTRRSGAIRTAAPASPSSTDGRPARTRYRVSARARCDLGRRDARGDVRGLRPRDGAHAPDPRPPRCGRHTRRGRSGLRRGRRGAAALGARPSGAARRAPRLRPSRHGRAVELTEPLPDDLAPAWSRAGSRCRR